MTPPARLLGLLLVASLAALAASGCGPWGNAKKRDQLRQSALRRRESGDLEGAIAQLVEAAAVDPTDASTYRWLVVCRLEAGDEDRAARDAAALESAAPGDGVARVAAAVAARRGRDLEKARSILSDAISHLSGDSAKAGAGGPGAGQDSAAAALSFALGEQGLVLLLSHHAGDAVEPLARALEASPDQPALHLRLAEAYRLSGDLDKAQKEVDQVLAAHPSDPYALYVRAECRVAHHESKGALDDLKAVLASDAGFGRVGRALFLAGALHYERRDYALADTFIKAAALRGYDGALCALWEAKSRIGRGDASGAMELLDGPAAARPETPFYRGRALLLMGKPRDALAAFESVQAQTATTSSAFSLDVVQTAIGEAALAVALEPSTPPAGAQEMGKRALQALAKVLDVHAEYGPALAAQARAIAWVSRDVAMASSFAGRAIGRGQTSFELPAIQAAAFLSAGKLQEGLDALDRAIDAGPAVGWLRAMRGAVLLRAGKAHEAEDSCVGGLARDGRDLGLRLLLVECTIRTMRLKEAKDWLQKLLSPTDASTLSRAAAEAYRRAGLLARVWPGEYSLDERAVAQRLADLKTRLAAGPTSPETALWTLRQAVEDVKLAELEGSYATAAARDAHSQGVAALLDAVAIPESPGTDAPH